MKPGNFINFSVVFGFFTGLIFAVAGFERPEEILFWTIVSTTGFYLITLFCVSVYIWFVEFDKSLFDKTGLDKRLEYFDKEFDVREKEALNIRRYIQNADFSDKPVGNGRIK